VRGTEYKVFCPVNKSPFFLSIRTPENKGCSFMFCVDDMGDSVGKSFPSTVFMGSGFVLFYRENRVQQQNALLRPW